MLLVSWQQWYEVFDRLGWKSPLPEELWLKLGGGPSRRIDWPDIFRLTNAIGWSEKHAQTLWLTLNNFAEKVPEPTEQATPYGEIEEDAVAIPAAPWEKPEKKEVVPVALPTVTVKDPQDKRSIQLPAWVARISKRNWILIGLAVLVLAGLYVYTGQSEDSIPQVDNGAQVVPDNNTSDVAAYQNFLATYYSWKTKNPAPQLCLMVQGCTTTLIKQRMQNMTAAQLAQAVAIYRQQGKGVADAIFAPQGANTVAQIKQTAGGKTVYMCATLTGKGSAVKAVSDGRYTAQNLMLGNIWSACANQAPLQ